MNCSVKISYLVKMFTKLYENSLVLILILFSLYCVSTSSDTEAINDGRINNLSFKLICATFQQAVVNQSVLIHQSFKWDLTQCVNLCHNYGP